MLHHLVFSNAGARLGERTNPTCDRIRLFDRSTRCRAQRARRRVRRGARSTSAAPGYGYPIRATDRWVGTWMLMNHRDIRRRRLPRVRATVVTGRPSSRYSGLARRRRLTGLDPDLRRARGRPARLDVLPVDDRAGPFTGRIVAALGQPARRRKSAVLSSGLRDRELLRSLPTWGGPRSLPYRIRPVLHEPSRSA